MTGYTVHTGSNEKYSEGWDNIFATKKKAPKKTKKKKAAPTASKKGKKKKQPDKQTLFTF